ncbi:MAG TPA: toluene tolerance protein [Methylophilaceae bacterium]|nr:toluene tolerance protein [Methylophilaceae bacterium]
MYKPVFFIGWLRKSRQLTAAEFEQFGADAEVLEQDAHGIKVLRLADGDILKLFRVKHLISSARIYSHARSFCRNADRLKAIGIPTMAIKQLFSFTNSSNTAVLYQPLEGRILRQIAQSDGLNDVLLQHFGSFVAKLHSQGVYFRSLHLGNIVVTENGKFGLIDIADLSIRPWKLLFSERMRNFRHICRLEEDRNYIGLDGWNIFSAAYRDAAGLDMNSWQKMASATNPWFSRSGMVRKS